MKPIPEWLEKHKNQWFSVGKLRDLFEIEGRAFTPWFEEVRPRLRVVTCQANNGTNEVKRYLVKQIWAFSLAHGISLLPNSRNHGPTEIENLRSEVLVLKMRLANANANYQDAIRGASDLVGADLLHALAAATDARPLQGVYLLLDHRSTVVYVGQSKNVLARMSGHTEKDFSHVRMMQTKTEEERMELEARLIKAFRPKLNLSGMGVGSRKILESRAVA